MNIRKKMLVGLTLAVFMQSAQVAHAVDYEIVGDSFLNRLSSAIEDAVYSRVGACAVIACGLAAYTCWYNSQKQYAAKHIADAKAYLKKSRKVHAWDIKTYPTEGSIYRAFHNNEQALFQAIDDHLSAKVLCQCEEYNRTKSMHLVIDKELEKIETHLSNLSKNDLERVALWVKDFSLPAIEERTQDDERELEEYITSHMAYRGLPSGRYFLEEYVPNTKKWFSAMVSNGSNWTIALRPFRLAKSFIWPYEGEACEVAWNLIKRYQRLQRIRKMLPNVQPSINPANRKTTGGCIAANRGYCLHYGPEKKNKRLDVNVHGVVMPQVQVQPQNHGL